MGCFPGYVARMLVVAGLMVLFRCAEAMRKNDQVFIDSAVLPVQGETTATRAAVLYDRSADLELREGLSEKLDGLFVHGVWRLDRNFSSPGHVSHSQGLVYLNLHSPRRYFNEEKDEIVHPGWLALEGELVIHDGDYWSSPKFSYFVIGGASWNATALRTSRSGGLDIRLLAVPLVKFHAFGMAARGAANGSELTAREVWEAFHVIGGFDPSLLRALLDPDSGGKDDACYLGIDLRLLDEEHPQSSEAGAGERPFAFGGVADALDCGWRLRLDHLGEFRVEELFPGILTYGLAQILCVGAELYAFYGQIQWTRGAPGASAYLSVPMLAWLAIIDASMVVFHMLMGLALESSTVFNLFSIIAFGKFIQFGLFEVWLIVHAWKSQLTGGDGDTPETRWDSFRRRLALLYLRIYLVIAALLYLSYNLSGFYRIALFVIFSFWIPQIYRNARHGYNRGLYPMFAPLVSVTRLFLPIYLFANKSNVASIEPQPLTLVALVGYVMAQVVVLALQRRLGPTFFLPARLAPRRYDYFSLPRDFDLRARRTPSSGDGADGGPHSGDNSVDGDGPGDDAAPERPECAICLTPISLDGEPEGQPAGPWDEEASAGFVGGYSWDENGEMPPRWEGNGPVRSSFMRTPCGHFFHPGCLMRWMQQKLECPQCRAALPPP